MYGPTDSSRAQERLAVGKPSFECRCGAKFTRKYSLDRHIQMTIPKFPCDKCDHYRGWNAFKRKDLLTQHVKRMHKDEKDQPAPIPHKTRKRKVPGCPFQHCEYYHGPDDATIGERQNDHFDERAHYIEHLREHNWSPYPCKVAGCDKVGRNGYFGAQAREKHYERLHPGIMLPLRHADDATTGAAQCNYCQSVFATYQIVNHQRNCQEKVMCGYLYPRGPSAR